MLKEMSSFHFFFRKKELLKFGNPRLTTWQGPFGFQKFQSHLRLGECPQNTLRKLGQFFMKEEYYVTNSLFFKVLETIFLKF
jgi:hypothetical protein